MKILLAQAPIEIVTDQPQAAGPGFPLWPGALFLTCAALTFVLALALRARRARIEANPSEHAFRALARSLRTPAREQSMLRKLASAANTTPVTLLLSDHALSAACTSFKESSPRKRELADLERLFT